jgi:putative tricarboxylic transport membrane protein
VTIKVSILIPLVIMFAFAGAFVFRSDSVDLLMLVGFGIFGIIAKAAKFDVMPMVMGFILGPPMEYAFGQTVAMTNGEAVNFFMTERLGAMLVLIAAPVIGYLLWRRMQTVTVTSH